MVTQDREGVTHNPRRDYAQGTTAMCMGPWRLCALFDGCMDRVILLIPSQ
uniref:Uncharacterized protein n=1 Tax=Picea glauca TaxID=3330 RepID=A0A117NHZ1_PICGL|nr:hypothetical protein ABT39_MTgene3680 [Picea glauca]